jgi:hypothetical protein
MLDNEKRLFSDLIDAAMPVYRMEASVETKRLWWGILKAYSIMEVRAAFSRHMSENGQTITPAHIRTLIEKANPDGRPGADEAWAMLPYKDEATSVVMTDEMSEAFGIAQQVDDKNGARMAFREAYNRIVESNKRDGIKPRWFASLGHDKNGRDIVLQEAVRLGRISQAYATGILPPPITERGSSVLALVASNGVLTDESSTEKDREIAIKRIAGIKAMLGYKNENQ